MSNEQRATFSRQELKAFELGQRMADAKFDLNDNPFEAVQPRLARRWLDGFVARTALATVAFNLGLDRRGAPAAVRRAA